MKALAVDLGGTHATCALVEDRTIVSAKTLPSEVSQDLASLLPLMADSLQGLMREAVVKPSELAGLAFSFCGLVDHAAAKVVSTNAKYEDAPALDLKRWCEKSLGVPFAIENDARMALLGEAYAGAARGFEDIVMVTLGTGIGVATMIRGRLLRGKHAQAGCLGGHFPVLFNGRQCTCGALGCAEAEASGWALPELCRSTPGFEASSLAKEEVLNFEALFRAANAGDTVAILVRDRCLAVWCALMVALVHAYDPEVVVVGGGVMKSASAILPFLQDYVDRYVWTPWGKVSVRSAQLGNQAGLLGAIPLLQAGAEI